MPGTTGTAFDRDSLAQWYAHRPLDIDHRSDANPLLANELAPA